MKFFPAWINVSICQHCKDRSWTWFFLCFFASFCVFFSSHNCFQCLCVISTRNRRREAGASRHHGALFEGSLEHPDNMVPRVLVGRHQRAPWGHGMGPMMPFSNGKLQKFQCGRNCIHNCGILCDFFSLEFKLVINVIDFPLFFSFVRRTLCDSFCIRRIFSACFYHCFPLILFSFFPLRFKTIGKLWHYGVVHK